MIKRLILLCAASYAILVLFVLSTHSYILVASLLSALPISAYLAIQYKLHRKNASRDFEYHRPGISMPFILVYVIPLVPIIATGIYFGYNLLEVNNLFTILIGFGMSLGFNYALVNIPLAIKHTKEEDALRSPLVYPLVTIIVPAYNEEAGIGRTIEGIAEVDYPNKEIIVVDDGSKDQTYKIASGYRGMFSTGRFSVVRKKNGGKASAINTALLYAKGEIIVVVDADAIIARDCLKQIIKQFEDPEVGAVAGNPKVLNRTTFWAKIQVLEYLVGISLFKRAYALFGVVMVVPGGLGAFRKELMVQGGQYDNDTLTEDFDITLKILKSGKRIVMSSAAISYSEVPENLKDLYKQRVRWQGGNLQTLIKHKDIMTNQRFGMLYKYGYPLILLTMLTLPFLGMIVSGFVVVAMFENMWLTLLLSFLVFTGLSFILGAIAIAMEHESWGSLIYAPLMVVGFKQLLDYFTVKSSLDVIFGRKLTWDPSRRYGMKTGMTPK